MMDNFVMIQAGDLIDSTIGIHFGMATLTAAAFGQIFSDVSGVVFGGVVDAAAVKLGLPPVTLFTATAATANIEASRHRRFSVGSLSAALWACHACSLWIWKKPKWTRKEEAERFTLRYRTDGSGEDGRSYM